MGKWQRVLVVMWGDVRSVMGMRLGRKKGELMAVKGLVVALS